MTVRQPSANSFWLAAPQIPRTAAAVCLLCGALAAPASAQPALEPEQAADELPPMTVEAVGVGRSNEEYVTPRSTAATRFEASTLEVPQSVQVIDRALIEDSGAVDVGDILRRVPSAYVGNTRLAPFTSFSWKIRGFDAAVTRNGFRQLYFEDVDQSALGNLERVEIIKGPGSAVYGAEGLGGTVNMVTRRPQQDFDASARLSAGRYDAYGTAFDVTGALTADGALTARLTGEIERADTFVDFQDLNRDNLSLTTAWDAGGPVRAFLLAEYQRRDTLPNPGLPVVGTVQSNGVGRVSRSTYLGEPEFDSLTTWSPLVQAWLEFDLGEHWTLSPRYQFFEFNVNQQQMRLRAPEPDGVTIRRAGRFKFHERDKTDTFQLELKGKLDTFGMPHELLLGYEWEHHRWTGDWFDFASPPAINALNPVHQSTPLAVDPTQPTFSGRGYTPSYYVQDLMHLTDTVTILTGVRHSRPDFKSEFAGDTARGPIDDNTSWQLGSTWQFRPDWSLFAGYGTGFTTEAVIGSIDRNGGAFEPEETRQWEAGIKRQQGASTLTLAAFEITRKNVTTTDPVDPDFSIQVGEQRVRGAELEFTQELTRSWFLHGGVAYLDGEVARSNDGDRGNQLPNVAPWQANLWTLYRFDANLTGLEIGLGGNFVGHRYGTLDNSYKLDAYTTVDASAAYQLTPKLKTELFLRNVLDERYYTGNNNFSVYPGEPRGWYLRLTMSL
ncbi:MAG: TonB-dependent siderophore receptor [Gammaproteobacteria bacterium]|nr:TonB-dependent siderophore receptor [Gammaproteobacteria bacterium]